MAATGCSRGTTTEPAAAARTEQAALTASASNAAAPTARPVDKSTMQVTAWLLLKDRADLVQARGHRDWAQRGRAVYDTLTTKANASQAGLRGLLQSRGVAFRPFWIANAIKVTASQATIDELARRPEVAKVYPDTKYKIPEPLAGIELPRTGATEWGLDNIGAPAVWASFGAKGDGIVVGNVDTGVQFDHPALIRQYRGSRGDGTYDHNYNWADPTGLCGSGGPCDNAGHGTHTMGTMVGDDGDPGLNQIGVAPHARWIAAKGCETSSCSTESLLAAGQFMLAPTDLAGQNPRPDLRPHIVNNSWGGWGGDPFYQQIVSSWVAAGIFPTFSNGNSGPSCNTAGSPGDYPESYAVGAYDWSNMIAYFSSRGGSAFGIVKPDIAAPGVDVRSAVPGSSYASYSGTSMAAPHLSGTVALIWSAAASLVGDIAATRALLDRTAIDTPDPSCGGTDGDNNVWGEGRVNAYAAVEQAPRGPVGTLQGVVTAAVGGTPVAGAAIAVTGETNRSTTSDASGAFSLSLPVGSYTVNVSGFGWVAQSATVTVAQDAVTVQDFALAAAPSHALSGTVRDALGNAAAGLTVSIANTPIAPVTTDAAGRYLFASVPDGTYDVTATGGGCFQSRTSSVTVAGDTTADFVLPQLVDAFGYSCRPAAYEYIEGTEILPLYGDDLSLMIALPFPVTFYGRTYSSVNVATNGFLDFVGSYPSYVNGPIPSPDVPNSAIYPFWDDLYVDGTGMVRTATVGSAPNRRFVVEWRDVTLYGSGARISFEVILSENGGILMQYAAIPADPRAQGNSATIGIEDETGTVGLQYALNQVAVSEGMAVQYAMPPSGFIDGRATDAADGQPVSGVLVQAYQGQALIRSATTDTNGHYRLMVPAGSYTVLASAEGYTSDPVLVDVAVDQVATASFSLRTGRASLSPSKLDLVLPAGQTRTRTLVLKNTGSAPLNWTTTESGGRPAATFGTAALVRNPSFDRGAPNTRGLFGNGSPAKGWTPMAPGDVISAFVPQGMNLAWGVGFNGNVWLGDFYALMDYEFATNGTPTGRSWPTPWARLYVGDMAYDSRHGLMCQLDIEGDNGIHCWNPATGVEEGSIVGPFPWTSWSQRGLAYREDDDSFYVGGWNQGVIYHVKGLSASDKGAVIDQCYPPDGMISGLAWNGAAGVLWEATNSPTDTIYELNPGTCNVLSTLQFPQPGGFQGAGLEMDTAGNLWVAAQAPNQIYLVDSGVPAFNDVPWMSVSPASGTLAPGAEIALRVTVDTRGMAAGTYLGAIWVQHDAARQDGFRVPVGLVVSGYQAAANAGGSAYTDTLGDTWSADRLYTSGGWGYVEKKSKTATANGTIAGTPDQPLYRTQRVAPYAYRFDNLPNGIYEVNLRFADFQSKSVGKRMFDIIIKNTLMLPAHDIYYDAGRMAADEHTLFVNVTDGMLDTRLISRVGDPVVNAVRVTHRPDR